MSEVSHLRPVLKCKDNRNLCAASRLNGTAEMALSTSQCDSQGIAKEKSQILKFSSFELNYSAASRRIQACLLSLIENAPLP